MAGQGGFPPNFRPTPEYLAQDNSAPLFQTCVAFITLEGLFMILLYISRYLSKDQKANGAMTLLMTAGFMTCCGKISLGILAVKIGGAGRHMMYLGQSDPQKISNLLKIQTALQIVCPLTTSLTKLAILSLLLQILGRTSQRIVLVIKITFALVLAILIVQVIIPFANCKPFSKTWNPMGPGECAMDSLNLWRYLSIPNVVTTLIMITIPLPSMYKLRVNLPTKFGIAFVFTICLLGVIAAIMRFEAFLQVKNFNDISYEIITPLCWTVAESGIYLVAGVLPTLRPLLRKLVGDGKFEKLLSRSFGRSTGSWGNRRASRFVAIGPPKPLPALPPQRPRRSNEETDIEFSKYSVSKYSHDGGEEPMYEDRVRPIGRL